MKPFKILSREKVLWEKFYKVEKHIVELPNGEKGEWFVRINRDAVVVIPISSDGKVLLQKNYRHGCGRIINEFCAGLIDDGETYEEAASRELSEETGYQAKTYIKLGEVFTNPTSANIRHHFILAENITKTGDPHREPEEQIEPFFVDNLEAADDFLSKNPTSSPAITGIHMAMRYFNQKDL